MSDSEKQLTEITIKVKRIPAVVFGIIGVVLSTLLAMALIVYSNQFLSSIATDITEHQSLLIVAVSLATAAIAFIILTILFISIVSILGHFNKGLRLTLFIFLVLAILFLIGAAIVGGVWLTLTS